MRRHTITLDSDAEAGVCAVTVPALRGCFTQGRTTEEVIERAREAIQGHIESPAEDGEPIPEDSIDNHFVTVDVPEPAPIAT